MSSATAVALADDHSRNSPTRTSIAGNENGELSRILRTAFGTFTTGVTVVTYEWEGELCGTTVNAFSSISLDPALAMLSFAHSSNAGQRIVDRPFVINILSEPQRDIAMHFAGKERDDLQLPWRADWDAPRLGGSLAWFGCRPWQTHDAGDHRIHLGEIVEFGHGESEDPLVFYRGRFASPLAS